jgi:O-antigen/teichoic acid export membrane protein
MALSSATALSQLLSIAIMPFLTRLYTPEQFGLMSFFLSISSVCVVLFTLRLEQAILIPKQDKNALVVVYLALFFSLFFTLLSTFICYVYYFLGGESDLGLAIFLIPASAFLFSAYRIVNNYHNRVGAYNKFAVNTLLFFISQLLLKLLFGVVGLVTLGLIWGVFIGRLITATRILSDLFSTYPINFKDKFFFIRAKYLFKRYKKFTTWLLSSDLINALAIQSPFFLIAYFYSNDWVGYFTLAFSVSSLPLQFIGTSVGNVFRGEASKLMKDTGRCDQLFKGLLLKLLCVLFPVFIFMYFISPFVFPFVFGKEWAPSGVIVQILCIMFFFQFIARVFSYLYILKERQVENFVIQLVLLLAISGTFLVGKHYFTDLFPVLMIYSAIYSLIYIFVIFRSYYFSKG